MRILVCGGRDYTDWSRLEEVLSREVYKGDTIISGAARGADRMAVQWAVAYGVTFEECPADWETHGKKAGFLRNIQMLDTGIDLVIAFPGGRGTAHMIGIAKKAGVEVKEIQ